MTDFINEIMDFFLNLIIDKSIDKMCKNSIKKIVILLLLCVISIFATGLIGTWFYLANKKDIAFIFWFIMLIIISFVIMVLYKNKKRR